jgi:hypothetical protein
MVNERWGCIFAAFVLVLSLAPSVASGQERITFDFNGSKIQNGVPSPWQFRKWAPLIGLGGFEATARVEEQAGKNVLFVKSVNAGFIVGAKRDVDASQYRFASWSWKAQTLPTGGSFKRRATNDQALQVLFGFDGGKVLGYIWDSTGREGAQGSGLAFREDVRVIVLRAGPSKVGQWIDERRNIYDDFRTLFETDPPQMKGVAIQSNSQHTSSTGSGWVGPIILTKN